MKAKKKNVRKMEGVRGMRMVKGKSYKKKPTYIPLVNIHKRNPPK
jgi:hypothetical protein